MDRIRRARASDAAAIGRVYVDTWRSIYAGLVPDKVLIGMSHLGSAASWARTLNAGERGQGVHVADNGNGEVVGFASHGRSRDPRLGFAGEVYTLYVLDDYQGRGLGRELLLAAFAGFRGRGLGSAVIWVLTGNPSRFFYEAMGGRRVGQRREKMFGTSLPETAYGWSDLDSTLSEARTCSAA